MSPTATVRVLVVDDDKEDGQLIVDLLGCARRAQFICDLAASVEECLSAVRTYQYDVLIVDYRLPGDRSGLDLARELKRHHFRLPVILVTGHGDRRLQAEAMTTGVSEFLEKGVFNADLLERTCLYAIGLNEKQGKPVAGEGGMFSELISLTRESVQAQTKTADEVSQLRQEMGQLRSDINSDIQGLESHMDSLKEHADKQKESILLELEKGLWGRWKDLLNWGTNHPVASIMLIVFVAFLIMVFVFFVNLLDTAKLAELIKALKGTGGMLLYAH